MTFVVRKNKICIVFMIIITHNEYNVKHKHINEETYKRKRFKYIECY